MGVNVIRVEESYILGEQSWIRDGLWEWENEDITHVEPGFVNEAFLVALGNKLIDFRRRCGDANDDGESSG